MRSERKLWQKGLLNKKLKLKFIIGFVVVIVSTRPQFHTYIAVFYFSQISKYLFAKTGDNLLNNEVQCNRNLV